MSKASELWIFGKKKVLLDKESLGFVPCEYGGFSTKATSMKGWRLWYNTHEGVDVFWNPKAKDEESMKFIGSAKSTGELKDLITKKPKK